MKQKTTLAYIAGLLDGEGSIVIGVSKRTGKQPNHWLQVGITNTNRPLIDFLKETLGGHISDSSKKRTSVGHKPCWAWRVMGNEAVAFLESVFPFLRIKQNRVKIAFEFQRKKIRLWRGKGGPHPKAEQELARREDCKRRLELL